MVYIDAKKVIETRIAESMGFDKYKQIMETVRKTDVSSDSDFQRIFNAFYRVRRNAEWRKAYYDLFEATKDSTTDFHQALHVLGNLAMQVAFDSQVLLNVVAQLGEVFFGKIVAADVRINTSLRKDLLRCGQTNAVNVGQADLDALVARKIDTEQTCHMVNTSLSS